MSEEKKCCGCCGNKELSNEQLEKVSGGSGWQNGKFICSYPYKGGIKCLAVKTVDGVSNVCCCDGKTSGRCCKEFKNNCTCKYWDKNARECKAETD